MDCLNVSLMNNKKRRGPKPRFCVFVRFYIVVSSSVITALSSLLSTML